MITSMKKKKKEDGREVTLPIGESPGDVGRGRQNMLWNESVSSFMAETQLHLPSFCTGYDHIHRWLVLSSTYSMSSIPWTGRFQRDKQSLDVTTESRIVMVSK